MLAGRVFKPCEFVKNIFGISKRRLYFCITARIKYLLNLVKIMVSKFWDYLFWVIVALILLFLIIRILF